MIPAESGTEVLDIDETFEARLNGQGKPILVTTTDRQRAFIGLTSPKVIRVPLCAILLKRGR